MVCGTQANKRQMQVVIKSAKRPRNRFAILLFVLVCEIINTLYSKGTRTFDNKVSDDEELLKAAKAAFSITEELVFDIVDNVLRYRRLLKYIKLCNSYS